MHALGFPDRAFPFDLELLYGIRPERFPLEALADFARLGTWLMSPYDPMRIEWAAKTAVARAVRETFKGRNEQVFTDDEVEPFLAQVHQAHFSLETVTFGLLRMPGLEYWDDLHNDLSTRSETALVIAATLLQLDRHPPTGVKPSMNRAVQQASYSSEFSDGVSRQTAKEIWEMHAPAAPFLLGERWLTIPGIEDDAQDDLKRVVFYSPGHRDFFVFFQFFMSKGVIKKLLSHAKFFQIELTRILAETGAAEVHFVEFPDTIPFEEMSIPNFTAVERHRISQYSSRDWALKPDVAR